MSFTLFMIATAILCYGLIVARSLLMPLIMAVFLWHLLNTLAAYIQGTYGIGRYLPQSLCLFIALLIISGIIFQLVSIVTDNVGEVIVRAPMYQENLRAILNGIDGRFHIKVLAYVNDFFQNMSFQTILVNLYGTFSSLTSNAFIIALYVTFLFLEQRVMTLKMRALFPLDTHYALASDIISQIVEDTQTYIGIKSAMSFITATASWVVMKIVGLDFAEFWALLIFFLNFIPNIGSMIATLFPALLALVQFQQSLVPFAIICLGITSIQFMVGNLLEPKFLGKQLNLSPFVILISLSIWGALWGLLGMFLAVPIMVILMIVFSHFEKTESIAILLSQNGTIREK